MARKASEQANMQICQAYPDQVRLLCVLLEAQEVTTEGVYRLLHACYVLL